MYIRQTLILEAFCENCNQGMLTPLLDFGFNSKKSACETKGEIIKCPKCQHENKVEEVVTMIPSEFLWFGTDDVNRFRDESVKKFLNK